MTHSESIRLGSGIHECFDVNGGQGISACTGIRNCRGVSESIFCSNCNGLYMSAFCTGLQGGAYMLFNKQSTLGKVAAIMRHVENLCKTRALNYYPDRYVAGLEYDPDDFSLSVTPAALLYIKSLEEFDEEIFNNLFKEKPKCKKKYETTAL